MDIEMINRVDTFLIRGLFNLENQQKFEFYVESIFPDICTIDGTRKFVTLNKFCNFMKLPSIISEKHFNVMDEDRDNFLSKDEFIKPLSKLYFGDFEETAKIIFEIYDFNRDNYINKADVKMIHSYLPLKAFETEPDYKNQMDSLLELDDILKTFFNNKNVLNFEEFIDAIQLNSEIYFQLLCFFYIKCPFHEKSIEIALKCSNSIIANLKNENDEIININNLEVKINGKSSNKNFFIPLPSINTRFSPVTDFLSIYKNTNNRLSDNDVDVIFEGPIMKCQIKQTE